MSPSIWGKIEGADELMRALNKQPKRFLEMLRGALPAEAETLKQRATAQVPVDTGELRDSAGTSMDSTAHSVSAAVYYADPKAPTVHEGTGYDGSKWLERSMYAFSTGFAERVAAHLRSGFGLRPRLTKAEARAIAKAEVRRMRKAKRALASARRKRFRQARRAATRAVRNARRKAVRGIKRSARGVKRSAKKALRTARRAARRRR